MTAKEIQKIIGKEQVLKGHNPVCENVKYLFHHWEHDVISRSGAGYIYEFEVKISRNDFLNEKKKKQVKHEYYAFKGQGIYYDYEVPNYFYYVCPENLISIEEIPEKYGLIYMEGIGFKIIRKARLLHKDKHSEIGLLRKVCRIYSERQFLGCCLLTHKNKYV